ncbi:Serine-threonine/tyrosine-protein kinase catalytic domain containing protein [Klebsormidium nitens]|uniref:Serine-threonine/tyrosine-protein kinase catalytic domain containing protein n=1 Tax=Klebsormidium nitens TaxID=105231 RepID=A0A1Y1IL93_KLENI|nr:Serine-threonine/tyrosine-protein kinase catalytic domain containing protein [Klebsormidium nitens]|eukprot:GAQ89901.1 Serine-threonine/tyrosine-protein kinase catalytic domain containing protein [Klebsormidium nitens]
MEAVEMVGKASRRGWYNVVVALVMYMSAGIAAVDGACTGVLDAEGLVSALATSTPGTLVTVCGDIQVTSTIKISQSISIEGQCPYPGCRIFSNAGIGTGVQLFQTGNGLGTVTFRNLWLDGGFSQPTFNSAAGYCPGGLTNFNGGAISTGPGTNLVADSVVFTSNSACAGGGAVNAGSNATISNCLFLNNTAMYGGGLSVTTGAALTIRNSNFSYNSARDRGSALWLYQSQQARIQGSLFMYNRALGFGGGAVVAFSDDNPGKYDSTIIIAGNTFANNTSPVGGGAILNHYSGNMFIIGNLFVQNYATAGGAIYLDHGTTTVGSPNTFLRNQADGNGPANLYTQGNASSTRFCPSLTAVPTGVGTDGGTGSPIQSCALVDCTVHNPCDPLATCDPAVTGLAIGCTCPASAAGSGFICDAALRVMSVGSGSTFTVPPAFNLAYGGNVSNIAFVLGPSPTGKKKRKNVLPTVLEEPKKLLTDSRWSGARPSTAASDREQQANKALGRNWRRFTYAELSHATGGFSRQALLGEGAFGQVYLATLPDGTKLAVKQLKDGGKDLAAREWLGELDALGRVRHRNLVSLRGYCVTDHDCFLVLDYAENGNLDSALRSESKPALDWDTRLNIAIGAARGLSYLHNDTDPPILHRDIKSANILLDSKMQAQVADFGLAKLIADESDNQSTMVRGTYGYLAPEMVYTGRVTTKSDVYSFGVVLLELATGLRALESLADGGKQNLVEAVSRNRNRLLVTVDPKLNHQFSPEAATRFITIALSCVARDDSVRPDMSDVLRGLESLAKGGPVSDVELPYQDSTINDSGEWFAASSRAGSGSELSGASSLLSHSTWSEPYGPSGSSSINYQMTMIHEGR